MYLNNNIIELIGFLIFVSGIFYILQIGIALDELDKNKYNNKKEFLVYLKPFYLIILLLPIMKEDLLNLEKRISILISKFNSLK